MAAVASTPPDSLRGSAIVEFFLLLWDEMDDWLGACRHLLRRQLA